MNVVESSPSILSEHTVQKTLDEKIRHVFGNASMDKRRLPSSGLKGRAIPGYVAEWVLDYVVPGEGNLSPADVAKVQEWTARVVPGPADANRTRGRLLRGEALKILTLVQVDAILTRGRQEHVAILPLLGVPDAQIVGQLLEKYPALLDEGMWGITELLKTDTGATVHGFKPMQATVNLRLWSEARREFTLDEWLDMLLLSMGYAPNTFDESEKLLLLCRLLPLVQQSLHLMELAPKGTGKSYLYENISPRVRLIGGNVTPAKLFVDNSKGTPGYLSRYKVVVLDEVQTLKFTAPEEIIANLKMFLANAQIQRGTTPMGSDCGLVMLANIALDDQQQPVHELLVRDLPLFMQETAFLDRLCGLLPGWRIRKLTGECFASGWGLKADFFGETLLLLRDNGELESQAMHRLRFSDRSYGRNEKGIRANTSALFKLLFPHGEATDDEFYRYCLAPAVRLRQGIWDQLYMMDAENHKYARDLRETVLWDSPTTD